MAADRLLLDTTVLIDVLRDRRPVVDRYREALRDRRRLYACAVTVEEIVRGATPDQERSIARLLRAMRIAPLGRSEGRLAGAWRREYAQQGKTLWQADCLIAAAAVGWTGGRLATANVKDFPMPELTVEHWPSG